MTEFEINIRWFGYEKITLNVSVEPPEPDVGYFGEYINYDIVQINDAEPLQEDLEFISDELSYFQEHVNFMTTIKEAIKEYRDNAFLASKGY